MRSWSLRWLLTAATATVIAASAAGCSTPQVSGTPTPQTSGSPTGSSGANTQSGAPHVTNPLDRSHAQAAPCGILTQQQVSALGITATGKPSDASIRPSCIWQDTSAVPSKMSFTVQFVTESKGGLSSLYVQADSLKKNGGYFEPVSPIQGYPAVVYGQLDDRKDGSCTLAVGVSDALQFSVSLDLGISQRQLDSCSVTQKVADSVMTNLRAGS